MLLKIIYKDGQQYTCFPREIRFDHFPTERIVLYYDRHNQSGVAVTRTDYINLEDIRDFTVKNEEDIRPTNEELAGNVGGLTFESYQNAFFKD